MKPYKVLYDVVESVDQHPVGPRIRTITAHDEENVKLLVCAIYDRRPTTSAIRFIRISPVQPLGARR